MRGEFILGRMKDAFEDELFEALGIEVGLDDRTFVDHLAVLHRLILPLHHLADVESRDEQVDALVHDELLTFAKYR